MRGAWCVAHAADLPRSHAAWWVVSNNAKRHSAGSVAAHQLLEMDGILAASLALLEEEAVEEDEIIQRYFTNEGCNVYKNRNTEGMFMYVCLYRYVYVCIFFFFIDSI